MATLSYSRSQNNDIQIKEDRKFDAIFVVARSDDGDVDFTSASVKMDIYRGRGKTLVDTLTSGTEITILTNSLTFSKTFTALEVRAYYYELYDNTNKVGISHGNLIVL